MDVIIDRKIITEMINLIRFLLSILTRVAKLSSSNIRVIVLIDDAMKHSENIFDKIMNEIKGKL